MYHARRKNRYRKNCRMPPGFLKEVMQFKSFFYCITLFSKQGRPDAHMGNAKRRFPPALAQNFTTELRCGSFSNAPKVRNDKRPMVARPPFPLNACDDIAPHFCPSSSSSVPDYDATQCQSCYWLYQNMIRLKTIFFLTHQNDIWIR